MKQIILTNKQYETLLQVLNQAGERCAKADDLYDLIEETAKEVHTK